MEEENIILWPSGGRMKRIEYRTGGASGAKGAGRHGESVGFEARSSGLSIYSMRSQNR